MSTAGFSSFLARKNIKPSAKLYFVDAMSAMAMGLFASLLIGTILDTLGDQYHWVWLVTAAGYASSATGIAIAVAIGVSLSAPPLVLYSLCAVGLGSYSVGGPLGAFFAVIVAAELGKAVSRETKVDILVTPTVTILSGLGVGSLIGFSWALSFRCWSVSSSPCPSVPPPSALLSALPAWPAALPRQAAAPR